MVSTRGTGHNPVRSLFSRSGNGLVSYYLNLVLDGVGITSGNQQLIFNGVLQVFNLGTACAGALLVDRVGRRKLWLTSAAGMVCLQIALLGMVLTTVLLLHAMDRRIRCLRQDEELRAPKQARRKPRTRHDLFLLRLLQHRHVRPAGLLHRRDVSLPFQLALMLS